MLSRFPLEPQHSSPGTKKSIESANTSLRAYPLLTLFIVIHQVYELQVKQMLHEMDYLLRLPGLEFFVLAYPSPMLITAL